MSLAFNIALHVLLVGSLVLFVGGVIVATLSEVDPTERLLRIAALAAGAMVTLGAQAAGVSYAAFTVDALAGARPASATAQIGATIFPALTGAAIGFFIVRVFNRNTRLAMRVLGFMAMLTGTAFLQVYAQATQTKGVFLGAAALPNVAFVTGIILTVVFTFDANAKGSDASIKEVLTSFLQRKTADSQANNNAKGSFRSLLGREPSDGQNIRVARRDPFSR
jgi:hypothetical protein